MSSQAKANGKIIDAVLSNDDIASEVIVFSFTDGLCW